MGTAGRKIGVGIAGVGMALVAAGVFAGGASAGQEGTERLECEASSLTVAWQGVDVADVASAAGQSFSDGVITITLSNAAAIPGEALGILTIGSMDFSATSAIDAVELQLWQSPGDYDFDTVDYNPAVTSGHLQSPDGSHPTLSRAPIKGLVFCYKAAPAPTTTTSTTSTTSTTVAVVPDQVVAPTTTAAPTTTVAAVEVLPQVVTAPQQIAFTGSTSGPLVTVGALLVLLGLSLVGIDRLGFVRRGKHAR
jgi:hypothetical protein